MSAGHIARRYADAGLHIFPCWPNTKHPVTDNGFKDATTDPALIAEWWGRWPRANVGLACGASGLVVIDFDIPKPGFGGADLLAELLKTTTTTATTPSGGLHFYYRQPDGEPLTNRRGKLPVGVDVRGAGGYVLLPFSGVTYTFDDAAKHGLAPGHAGRYEWQDAKAKPAPLPGLVAELLTAGAPTAERRQEFVSYHAPTTLERGAELLRRLKPQRADDYDDWIKTGMALHSEFGDAGLTLWEAWSAQSAKYHPGDCVRKWKSFNSHGVTLGTLAWMAEQDDPTPTKPTPTPTATKPTPTAANLAKAAYRASVDSFIGGRLTAESMAVRYAQTDGCNQRLNLAAWRLGRLVGAGRLTESEVRAALIDAALAAGLGERESLATIASGLRAGVQHG